MHRSRVSRLLMILCVCVTAGLVLAACGGEDEEDTSGNGSDAAETGSAYPQEAVDNFMASCETGADSATCECVIDEFQDTVPFEEFEEIDREIIERGLEGLSPEQEETFESVINACGGSLPGG